MSFELQLDNFQGPFDLLLDLLKKRKLEITELSIGQITNDYLEYVSKMDASIEELSGFLIVAAKLALDKSLAVLLLSPEEDEIDIEDSLKKYAAIKERSRLLARTFDTPFFATRRKRAIRARLKPIDLMQFSKQYFQLKKSIISRPKAMNVKNRKKQLELIKLNFIAKLKDMKRFTAQSAIENSRDKTEAIVGMLAILDLIKRGSISVNHNSFRIESGVV